MEAKIRAGNSGIDVVVPSNYAIEGWVADNLIEPLDYAQLPNFKKAAFIVFIYSIILTGGISFLAVLIIPDDIRMKAARILNLDDCIEFLAEDELLEVTPQSLRLRKRILNNEKRLKDVKARERMLEGEGR
mgnify:CR=1 FL=1